MTLIKAPNPTLKGHKLFLLPSYPTPQHSIDSLRTKFPDLEIVVRQRPFKHTGANEELSEDEWKDVTIFLTGSAVPDAERAPNLAYVQLTSAGINHLLNNSIFRDTDIAFCTANGVHGPQISEWVISTFLAFQHHIPRYLEFQQEGKWNRMEDAKTEDAVGRRVGILGYGSIGRQIARVSIAMGMDVHAYTLHPKDTCRSRQDHSYTPPGLGDPEGLFPSKWFSGSSTEDLHDFLSSDLDLLVIALPLTEQTRHLIGRAEFEAMSKKRTYVSNIARGPIIKTDDLIKALDTGVIRGAALDVTDPEPLHEGHPLWKAKNLILTPHVSGASTAYYKRVLKILELNLTLLGQGKELTNKVNRKQGY